MEDSMNTQIGQRKSGNELLDIPSAAYLAGFNSRHFRRIIEEDRIPVKQVGGKNVIVARDLEEWKATRGEARLDAAIQQLDVWIKSCATIEQPVIDWDDAE
jgi:hypothetical protein